MNLILAQVAKEEAKKNYHGNTEAAISNLHPLLELFSKEDEVTFEILNADWSGSFAYFCIQKAGMSLPLRYPDPRVRHCFAAVSAWEQYARLPKIHLWHSAAELPEVGDLAVLEHAPGGPGQMGVVLRVEGNVMELAMGNYHNHSAIIEHPLDEGVRGYVRL